MPYKDKPLKSYFKEEKPAKKTKQKMWNDVQKRARQKAIKNHIITGQLDNAFYLKIWNERAHTCEECFCNLNAGKPDGEKYLHNIRFFCHHILAKSKYKQFRHTALNIALLCRFHHSCVESAISAPKMKIAPHLESIKQHLLS